MTTTDTLGREQVDSMLVAIDPPELRWAEEHVEEADRRVDELTADAKLAATPEERSEIREQLVTAIGQRRDAKRRRKAVRRDLRAAVRALRGRGVALSSGSLATELISIRERRLLDAVHGPSGDHVHAAPTSRLTHVPGEIASPKPAQPSPTITEEDDQEFFRQRAERNARRRSWWATLFGRDTAPRGVTPCGAWMPRSRTRCVLSRGHAGDHRAVR